MQFLGMILLSIAAAVCYGVVHDQITARICVEYFTIGHPPVFGTENPTLLGIGWGILATWWVGLFLGIPLAMAARCGSRPPRSVRSLIAPVGTLLLCMACCALMAGATGYKLAATGRISLNGRLAELVPADRQVRFLSDLWAHNASYLSGFAGGIVLTARVWRSRARQLLSE